MIKIVTHDHRARALKRLLDDRIPPHFVEDLAMNSPMVREAALLRIEPRMRRRIVSELETYLAAHPEIDS